MNKLPEEIIEDGLIKLVGEAVSIPTQGFLGAVAVGELKHSEATFVQIKVDLSEQELDRDAMLSPLTFSVEVVIRVAVADDPNGELFRDVCREVFYALAGATGDGCVAFDAMPTSEEIGFACDSFVISGSSSSADLTTGAETAMKIYNASLTGRIRKN